MDFLNRVAHRIFYLHGNEMEKQVIVLPSRRAGLYLARYIAGQSHKPVWSPRMLTVNELFHSFTGLKQASHEMLIFELYEAYRHMVNTPLSLDDFWPWAEVIISDFNDIDFYMADAGKLYSNISDMREIDDRFGGLDEERIEIIRRFWISFDPASSGSSARNTFRSVWKMLAPLYDALRVSLRSKGYAGEGMLSRDVAVSAMNGTLNIPSGITWHMVGLNALNECEKKLFAFLRSKEQAAFYWDDNHSFMNDPGHRASLFLTENIRLFGNDLPAETAKEHIKSRKWFIIDTPSDTAQAKMLPWVFDKAGIEETSDLTDTAVILADEKLLMPVLTSLPSDIEEINVTMGHPFRYTPLYSFLKALFSLARSARRKDDRITFRAEDLLSVLRHQYFRLLNGEDGEIAASEIIAGNMIRVDPDMLTSGITLGRLIRIPETGTGYAGYLSDVLKLLEEGTFRVNPDVREMSTDREYIRMAMTETGKLGNLIESYNYDLKPETTIRIIDRTYRKLVVPFSGEPLRGIQVMGVLETRALEFRNIIFLSLNEGIFPGQAYDNTYIPYNIRRAFGLPTINEHESVYSYHFYRLLRKPSQGWFMYNSTAQGLNSGEMSRYLIQMKYDPEYSPEFCSMNITVGRSRLMDESLPKTKDHIRILTERYSVEGENRELSPSALNTWLNCRMRFYYRYVCGLPEEDKLEKDIDQRRFGNIMHEVMKILYEPLRNSTNASQAIRELLSDETFVKETIVRASAAEMNWSVDTLLSGRGVIIVDVLDRYVKETLRYDGAIENLKILNLEDKFSRSLSVEAGPARTVINIGGRLDRVDMVNGYIRVIDYKTGTPKISGIAVDDLFDEEKDKKNDALFQTLFYCDVLSEIHHGTIILPAVYWVQQISSDGFDPVVQLSGMEGSVYDKDSWDKMMGKYRTGLISVLNRIFSPEEEFVMTQNFQRCTSCPFNSLCRR